MITQEKLNTAAELWELSRQAGDDKRLELIEGRIVERSPAGDTHTELSMLIAYLLMDHVLKNDLGIVTGSDGGYILFPDTVCVPDVGFLSQARLSPRTGGYEVIQAFEPTTAVRVALVVLADTSPPVPLSRLRRTIAASGEGVSSRRRDGGEVEKGLSTASCWRKFESVLL